MTAAITLRTATAAEREAISTRATQAGISLDSRKDSVPCARPYVLVLHLPEPWLLEDLASIWRDVETAEVASTRDLDPLALAHLGVEVPGA